MKLLDWNTSPEDVLEEFPMLENMTVPELVIMKDGCEEIPEDAPFVRAIDILLKHVAEGRYYVPDDEDDDFPGGSRARQPVV